MEEVSKIKRLPDMSATELSQYLTALAGSLHAIMPPEHAPGAGNRGKALFALLVFDEPGLAHYTSNADRETMIFALRESASRLEQNQATEIASRNVPEPAYHIKTDDLVDLWQAIKGEPDDGAEKSLPIKLVKSLVSECMMKRGL